MSKPAGGANRSTPDRSRLLWLVQKPFAHRGLHDEESPENTLGAFAKAVGAGYPIELDVTLTAEGRVAVIHDQSLRRLTGFEGVVSETSWSQLRSLHVCGSAERIPCLEEVLDLVAGRVAILIELKMRRFTGALEAGVVRAVAGYSGPLAVQSFNPSSVAWFRFRHPGIPRGQLSCAFDTDPMAGWKKFLLSAYAANIVTAPHFLGHHLKCLPSLLVAFLRCFTPVIAWTIRSPADALRSAQYADNYIFEGFQP